ncbi:ABC transporter substrate-binding protein [Marinilactibacillus sp. XAAS-LB27]|uniref:ABC transporter substrate-binding protein n=1 Tax=Marinilactibacillus sp. XAAS-LB27 TaxID=3114538 RepID=UPI002E1817F4|nr:ABC transporter substrate-binding protein [Marinilactibacillus sp. XAAS-LB27]
MTNTKQLLKLGTGILAASTLLMTACGTDSASENTGTNDTTDDATSETSNGETIEITFWHAMNGPHQEAVTALTEAFNDSQDQYRVVEQNQGGYDDLNQAITGAGVAGNLPTMSQLTSTDVPELATNELLLPLSDEFLIENGFQEETLSDIYEGFKDSSIFNEQRYAMPFSKSTRLMFINEDILEEFGVDVPESWEDIRALGEMMVDAGDDRVAMGLENGFDMEFETMARQNGTDFINGDTLEVEINSTESVEALTFLSEMLEEGYARTAGEDGYFSGPFGRGESALYIGSSAGLAHVAPVADENGIQWGTAEVPTFNDKNLTMFAGNDIGLYSSASDEEQAGYVAYINFLLQPENTAQWAMETGYVPIVESALEVPEYASFLEEDPRNEAAASMLSYGITSPTFAGYGEYRNALTDAMEAISISNEDPQSVLDHLQSETESIIESNN